MKLSVNPSDVVLGHGDIMSRQRQYKGFQFDGTRSPFAQMGNLGGTRS